MGRRGRHTKLDLIVAPIFGREANRPFTRQRQIMAFRPMGTRTRDLAPAPSSIIR